MFREVVFGLVICSCAAWSASADAKNPLSHRVPAYTAEKKARLSALVHFARANEIPLGIECFGDDLEERINLSVPAGKARHTISAILGNSRHYSLSASKGVVSIRCAATSSPIWLDQKIRRFHLERTTVPFAFASLWMALEMELNPSVKGFAGDFPPSDPADEIGPIDATGVRVRDLLNRLASISKRTSWIISRPGASVPGPAETNHFWTIMYTADPKLEPPLIYVNFP